MGLLTFTGMVRIGDTTRTYYESEEEKATRLAFEKSHTFKIGDEVYLTASWLADGRTPRAQYADTKGIIQRIKTEPEIGACIRVNFGGVGLNIWKPNEDLIRVDTATEVLYEK